MSARKIRWKCQSDGCYLEKTMPDWGVLEGVFPREIFPTDIDGLVEIGGRFLIFEWKRDGAELTGGQENALTRITKTSKKISAIVIYGDPRTMDIQNIRVIHGGASGDKEPCDLSEFKKRCRRWAVKSP